MWDWGRLGLDGRPRPINIGHGKHVIQWNRTEPWVRREIYNKIDKVAEGDGWIEEHTGLHECEFIETRRHWFTKPVLHKTDGSVNVLNLVEGREAIVESSLCRDIYYTGIGETVYDTALWRVGRKTVRYNKSFC